jgi:hypothetical protein
MVALKDAAESGVQVTTMLQLPPTATAGPQLFDMPKSVGFVPARVMPLPLKLSCPVPEFVSLTVVDGLVLPTRTLPNATDVGARVTAGVPTTAQLPPVMRGCG